MVQTHEQRLEYGRRYYREHREEIIARQLVYQKNHPESTRDRTQRASHNFRERKRRLVRKLKKRGCYNCGEINPICLDFHHVDPEKKTYRISDPLCGTEESIREEASKCILLCANCHRKEEWRIRNGKSNHRR